MTFSEASKKFNEAQDKRIDMQMQFIKQVLLMGSALFGFLVSIHKPEKEPHPQLFSTSIVLLSAGLLLLCIGLYRNISAQEELVRQIKLQIKTENYQSGVSARPYKIFHYCLVAGYWTLAASVVSLTIYAIQ